MSKMVQVRNVPDDVHRELRIRAMREGLSLSDYLLRLAKADVARPHLAEVIARIEGREPIDGPDSVTLVRQDRDSR